MTDPRATTVAAVDDNRDLLSLYRAFLEPRYPVRTAATPEAAHDIIDDDVDVVLLDRRMPSKNGDQLLDELRERELSVMVAMVTAVEPDVDIIEMPFDDYLVKPVTRTQLTDTVDSLARRQEYNQASQELYQLASKRAALAENGLTDTAEYDQVCRDLDRLLDRSVETLDRIDDISAFQDVIKGEV